MIKIQVVSDTHLEFHEDKGKSFIDYLNPKGVDVLVLAGDITMSVGLTDALKQFCDKFPEVVYVEGNHEYYRGDPNSVRREIRRVRRKNLHWLNGSSWEIDGVRFVGGTMWFRKPPDWAPKSEMNDFNLIRDFEPWVYETNKRHCDVIEAYSGKVAHEDLPEPRAVVVVTHHLPSYKCVAHEYRGSYLNPFFVCEMDNVIQKNKPEVCIMGHSHVSQDERIYDTRMVRNPFGYLGRSENPEFDWEKVIEI